MQAAAGRQHEEAPRVITRRARGLRIRVRGEPLMLPARPSDVLDMRSPCVPILTLSCLAMTAVSCGGAEAGVTRVDLGASAEARDPDCPVAMRPSWPEAAGTRPLAELTVHCATARDPSATRARCQETLRQAACASGADVAYGLRYHPEVGGLRLEAKVGLGPRPPAPEVTCTPACSPGYECSSGFCVEVCEPRCEAGFTCEAGECQPLCRPSCDEGETCSAERRCVAESPEDPSAADAEADEAGEGAAADGQASDEGEAPGDEAQETGSSTASAEADGSGETPSAPASSQDGHAATDATGASAPQADATDAAEQAPAG